MVSLGPVKRGTKRRDFRALLKWTVDRVNHIIENLFGLMWGACLCRKCLGYFSVLAHSCFSSNCFQSYSVWDCKSWATVQTYTKNTNRQLYGQQRWQIFTVAWCLSKACLTYVAIKSPHLSKVFLKYRLGVYLTSGIQYVYLQFHIDSKVHRWYFPSPQKLTVHFLYCENNKPVRPTPKTLL